MILKNGNIVYNSHSFRLESDGAVFALAMLIIAVLVGAGGWRNKSISGLRDANIGLGLIAGLSMTSLGNDKTPSLE